MDGSEDQITTLKQRIRNLEQALAESEALTLAQIECSNRLEQQLFESQADVSQHERQLSIYQHELELMGQGPAHETMAEHEQHIQELQTLIWQLERRPTPEQFQILKQHLETKQMEIDTLKVELARRLDPVKVFELQQEISVLKEYTQQLNDRSTNMIQVQQKYLELRSQYNELEEEINTLRQELDTQRSNPVLSREPNTTSDLSTAQYQELLSQLQLAQERLIELEMRPDPAEFDYVLTELAYLKTDLTGSQELAHEYAKTCQELETQLSHVQAELSRRPDPSSWYQVQQETQSLDAQLTRSQKDLAELQALCQEQDQALEAQRTLVHDLQDQLVAQAQELAEQKKLLQERQEQLQENAEHLIDLSNRPHPSEWLQLQTDFIHQKGQLTATEQDLTHALQRSLLLETQLQQLQAQQQDQHEWEQAQDQVQQLKLELVAARYELSQLQQLYQQQHVELEQTHLQLGSLRHTLDIERQATEQLQTMQYNLESQLNVTQAEMQELQQRPDPTAWAQMQADLHSIQEQLLLTQTHASHQEQLNQHLQKQLAELEEVKVKLSIAQTEQQALSKELAQRPTLAQWQEAQRRQELIEAHHLVSQKQVEKLQLRVEELETECVQTHAYAQTQEKEVAHLEDIRRELEYRLTTLQPQLSTIAPVQPFAPPAVPRPSTPLKTPAHSMAGIPPLSLVDEAEVTERIGKLKPMAGVVSEIPQRPQGSVPIAPARSNNRVDLPAFVVRRR